MESYIDNNDLHMTRKDSAVMCGVVLIGFIALAALIILAII